MPELPELRAHFGLDLRIRARRVRVELEAKQVAIGLQHGDVGVPHRLEDLVRVQTGGPRCLRGCFEAAGDLRKAVADSGQEEFLLRSEQLEQVWLRDAGATSDRLRWGPGEAATGEFHDCRRDDGFSSLVCCQSGAHVK